MLDLPDYVIKCINNLENNGFEAWCVGGSIRDLLLKRTPFDYDVTTNAKPNEIINLFNKTIPIGVKHGTITVILDNHKIEVTTYRNDGIYSDHRKPDNVDFVNNIHEDLKRRDFTINAICYNPRKGIYDPLCGIDDLNNKTVRAIGNAEQRFNEDSLRIIRCFRFSSELDFKIDNDTLNNALKKSFLLKYISAERIYPEIKKIFLSSHIENMTPLISAGALNYIGITKSNYLSLLSKLPVDFAFRMSVFCTLNQLSSNNILQNLKADTNTVKSCLIYNKLLSSDMPENKHDLKIMLNISNEYFIKNLIKYYELTYVNANKINVMFNEILDNHEPYKVDMLDIDGNDLLNLGYSGKDIGNKLNELNLHVIDFPSHNKKDILIKYLM